MDFKKLSVEETSVLHLRGADEELLYEGGDQKKPVTITLYSPGSKTYAKAQAARNNRMMDRIKKKGKSDLSAEDTAQENATFLAACTHTMTHVEMDKLEGDALFQAVYSDTSIGFVGEQAGKHLGDWANFTKGSAKS